MLKQEEERTVELCIKGARQLEPGWSWPREDLAQGISGLTGAAFLSEEDLTCWDGAERRPAAEAEGWTTFSARSQGSYERKAVGKSQEDKLFC